MDYAVNKVTFKPQVHYLFGADETLLQQLRQQVRGQLILSCKNKQNCLCHTMLECIIWNWLQESAFADWCWYIVLRPGRPRESDHLLRQRGHHLQGLLSRLQVFVYLTYQSAYKLVISESYGSLSEACRSPTTLDLWFFGWPCPPSSVAPSLASRLKIMKTAWSLIRVKPWSLK